MEALSQCQPENGENRETDVLGSSWSVRRCSRQSRQSRLNPRLKSAGLRTKILEFDKGSWYASTTPPGQFLHRMVTAEGFLHKYEAWLAQSMDPGDLVKGCRVSVRIERYTNG